MNFKILTKQEVKQMVSKYNIFYREFYNSTKIVYGAIINDEIVAMIPTSNNVELENTRKIYSIFTELDNGKNVEFLKYVVNEIQENNKHIVIYTDCLTQDKEMFESAGFKFTKEKNNLKRYGSLHRGVFYN